MNNPKSTVLGWGSLIAAAGISYYFAKKGIDKRRAQQAKEGSRPTEKLDWRQKIEAAESSSSPQNALKAKTEATSRHNVSTREHQEEEIPGTVENIRQTK